LSFPHRPIPSPSTRSALIRQAIERHYPIPDDPALQSLLFAVLREQQIAEESVVVIAASDPPSAVPVAEAAGLKVEHFEHEDWQLLYIHCWACAQLGRAFSVREAWAWLHQHGYATGGKESSTGPLWTMEGLWELQHRWNGWGEPAWTGLDESSLRDGVGRLLAIRRTLRDVRERLTECRRMLADALPRPVLARIGKDACVA
jgi:hypothetical protein